MDNDRLGVLSRIDGKSSLATRNRDGDSESRSRNIAPLEPGADWVPVDPGAVTPDTTGGGTPVPDSP